MKFSVRGNPEEIDPSKTIQYRNRLGSEIVAQLQSNSPVGEDGILAAAWRFELTARGVKIINDSGYAPAVEGGTPSPIVATNAPALSFFSQGQWWVLEEVDGQAGQYFVKKTLQSMFPSSMIQSKD